MKNKFEIGRRKLLAGVGGIGVAGAGAGTGTWAYFSDEESSDANTIASGNIDLTVSNGGQIYWNIDSVTPGQSPVAGNDLTLGHVGSVEANHLEVDFDNNTTFTGSAPTNGMGYYMVVEEFSYYAPSNEASTIYVEDGSATTDGSDAGFSDVNSNGWIDLDDLASLDTPLDDFEPPEAGGEDAGLIIRVSAHKSMGNGYQNATLKTDITFALHQDSSQDL